MARYAYDRLTALDNSFLVLERPNAYMHVASTQIYDAGPMSTEDGGIDAGRFRKLVAGVLHRIPRYRQKLKWIPLEGTPVWVDDDQFNLDYHIRHTSLPRPGSESQLKALSARIMQHQLDRERPLWELWLVEGLQDGRFAVISKVHHCMIDGVSGVDLMRVLMSVDPDEDIAPEQSFVPRSMPSALELFTGEVTRRARLPLELLRDAGVALREAEDVRRGMATRLRALLETLGQGLRGVSETPINQDIGPHRRFDWLSMELEQIKALRRALGGSLNDIVLTIVTGAVRRFMIHRQVDPAGLEFRILAPVSVRTESEHGAMGNRVSAWIVPLPLGEADPREQLAHINETTTHLKESKSAVGAEALTQAAEWTPGTLLALGARNVTRLLPFNMVVTNVPGPQVPMYSLGAKMTHIYPNVPLMDHLGLGIALMSYDGSLDWGFNADFDLVPDLEVLVDCVRAAYDELQSIAGEGPRLVAGAGAGARAEGPGGESPRVGDALRRAASNGAEQPTEGTG